MHRRGGWPLALALVWTVLWACAWAPARGETLTLARAQAAVIAGGATERGPVTLPYHWDRHHPGHAGSARFEMAFTLEKPPAEPYGVLIDQVGNAFEVWLNGVLLQRHGDLRAGGGADHAKAPQYVSVPVRLLREQNALVVLIRADAGRRAGLSPLRIGLDAELKPRYRAAMYWHLAGSLVVAILSVLVGALALMLWLTQAEAGPGGRLRRDPLYLYVGLAEWAWALRVSDRVMQSPPLPWPAWNGLIVLALTAWVCCIVMFCVTVAGWRERPAVRALCRLMAGLLVLASPVGVLSILWQRPGLLTLWYAVIMLLCAPFSVAFFVAAWQRGASRPHRWLAAVLALNVAVGVRDWLAFRFSPDYAAGTWLRYSALLFGLVLACVAIARFRAASTQARELSAGLAARVAQREQELASTYGRLESAAREQARTHERERILRNMHDGVGAHISAAIRQLQSGRSSADEVLRTLHDSMDQLKLSIDAMQFPAGDVQALLAGLRYRLEPRLTGAGIALEWAVHELPEWPGLDARGMHQLQFLLFEAISNVLQHAYAHGLRIEAGVLPQGLRIAVVDDGRGFDASRPPRALQARAAALGARLDLQSAPGRTAVVIVLPAR